MRKNIRVLHGLVNYGTQAGLFARELRKKGIYAISLIHSDPSERIADIHLLKTAPFPRKFFPRIWNNMIKLYFFIKCNTFHFYFGKTLLPNQLDLPYYRIFGKKVIFEYLGNDIRPYKWLVERYDLPENHRFYIHMNTHDNKTQKRINHEKIYVDYLVSCLPSHIEFAKQYQIHVQEVLPIAIDVNEIDYKPISAINDNQTIKILHAPTKRIFKGTEYIIQAIEALSQSGYQIDFKIVEGVTHQELMKEYEWCDLFIDQISVGWYGTASIEAMAVGRPVCAYIDDIYFQHIDYKDEIPVMNLSKENIIIQLKEIIDHKEKLPMIGEVGRKFVEKYHNIEKVTDQLIDIYKNIWME